MQEVERLAQAVTELQADAERAGEALASAQAKDAEVNAKILASDGGDETERLAGELSVAQAKVKAFSARMSDKVATLDAAREALAAAEALLDEERAVETRAEFDAAVAKLEKAVPAVAELLATDLAEIERLRQEAWVYSERVQVAAGIPVENLVILDGGPMTRPDLLAKRIGALVHDLINEAKAVTP